jgi:hypothetical protein
VGVQALRRAAGTRRAAGLLAAALVVIGSANAVSQPGFADGTGPVLVGISFSPANALDVSSADQPVAVYVQATDADSPIASGSVTLTNGAVTESFFFTAADLQAGMPDTYLTGAQTFGVADVGTWTVQGVELIDSAGTANTTATSPAMLTVTAAPDTDGPTLSGPPSFSPSSVDPSSSDQTVTLALHIADRVTGFDVGFAELADAAGDSIAFGFSSMSLTGGTPNDGDYAVQFTVPTQQHSGTYRFAELDLFDRDANASTIDTTGFPSLSVTTRDVPGAPTGLTAAASDGQVALSWTPPTDAGSDPITGYVIEYSTDYGATWSVPSATGGTGTDHTVTGLSNGTDYVFQVAAVSAAGTGAFSSNTDPVTPAASSTAPSDVVGVPGDSRVDLTWAPPTEPGGTPVIEYLVRYSTDNGITWSDPHRTSSPAAGFAETGLANGTAYLFEVAAATSAGPGPYSDPSAPITPATVPGAPTGVAGTAGDGQIALLWTAPADDGGSPVTGYLVESSTDGTAWSYPIATGSAATAFTVAGLADGTAYVLRVAAVNAAGPGAFSDPSAAVTPMPPAPSSSSVPPPPPSLSSSVPPPPPSSSSSVPAPPTSTTPKPTPSATPSTTPPAPATVDPTALTARAPRFVGYDHRLVVSGRLRDASTGKPLAHATLTLWSRTAGHAFVARGTRSTSNVGTVRFTLHPKANASYRWTFAGSAAGTKSTSPTLHVRVRQLVTATVGAAAGGTWTLHGAVTPARAATVYLQRRVNGHWRAAGHVTATVRYRPDGTRRAGYAFTLQVHKAGQHRFRVYRSATASLAAGHSRTVTLTLPR